MFASFNIMNNVLLKKEKIYLKMVY